MTTTRSAATLLSAGAKGAMIACLALGPTMADAQDTAIDLSKWSPEYVRSIAGTAKFDTAAACAKVTPLDYKGRVSIWWTGPNDASPDIERKINDDFWSAWKATYPNIETDAQNTDYNVLLDKLRTALLAMPPRCWSGCRFWGVWNSHPKVIWSR